MGYYTQSLDSNFEITEEQLNKIKWPVTIETRNNKVEIDSISEAGDQFGVELGIVRDKKTCEHCNATSTYISGVDGIEVPEQKNYYLTDLLNFLAPYVKDDSYIEMKGEDGEMWRWVFKDGKMKEVQAKIVWEE